MDTEREGKIECWEVIKMQGVQDWNQGQETGFRD